MRRSFSCSGWRRPGSAATSFWASSRASWTTVAVAAQVGHAERRQAVLAGAQQIARSAHFEIEFREPKAVDRIDERLQPLDHFLASGIGEHRAITRMSTAGDPAAHLMKLSQSKSLGSRDRHQRGVGHVDADFDDARGHQHLRSPLAKLRIAASFSSVASRP